MINHLNASGRLNTGDTGSSRRRETATLNSKQKQCVNAIASFLKRKGNLTFEKAQVRLDRQRSFVALTLKYAANAPLMKILMTEAILSLDPNAKVEAKIFDIGHGRTEGYLSMSTTLYNDVTIPASVDYDSVWGDLYIQFFRN
jgi:hypothetical protein